MFRTIKIWLAQPLLACLSSSWVREDRLRVKFATLLGDFAGELGVIERSGGMIRVPRHVEAKGLPSLENLSWLQRLFLSDNDRRPKGRDTK